LHLVGILYPHINDDARSKSHQIYKHTYEIKENILFFVNLTLNKLTSDLQKAL